jgi:hypothetical protein
MPRETVRLSLSGLFPPEPAATFYSTIAYPDPEEVQAREGFWFSLCRWAIVEQCRLDPSWALNEQAIRVDVFMRYNNDWLKNFSKGLRRFNHRLIVAQYLVMPQLYELTSERTLKVDGFEPNVENLCELAMAFMRSKSQDDQRNLKTRVWKPSRPVVHAAAAFALWKLARQELPEHLNPLGNMDPFFACLSSPQSLKFVLVASEIFRHQMPSLQRFKVKEEDTIQFLCD